MIASRYKDLPGSYMRVTRHNLFKSESSAFEGRCFEVEPRGYTSFERHGHEHFVVVLAGRGRVRLGDEWSEIGPFDVVTVGPMVPHQFANPNDEPLSILCIVDRERDRPELISESAAEVGA